MNDLELLREIFKDTRIHVGIGTIDKLGLSLDGSKLRVLVGLLPEKRQIVAEMTFSDVYQVTFPELNDLAIVVFSDGHPDDAYVVKIVNNKEEPIPVFARTGNTVHYSRPGKKNYLGSDTKIEIGHLNSESTEPLVLGNVFKSFADNLLQKIADLDDQLATMAGQISSMANTLSTQATDLSLHTHICSAPTAASAPPDKAPQFVADAVTFLADKADFDTDQTNFQTKKSDILSLKASPIDDRSILSDIAFTEK